MWQGAAFDFFQRDLHIVSRSIWEASVLQKRFDADIDVFLARLSETPSVQADCVADFVHAGPEIGVASTKAFTSQVVVLSLIALALGLAAWGRPRLQAVVGIAGAAVLPLIGVALLIAAGRHDVVVVEIGGWPAPFGIIMSGIGVISLAGVVVNNAIVLLDAIRQQQERGLAVRDAVVTAGMIRFRPVLLTAITTMLGLLPMAIKLNIDFLNLSYQFNTESSQWWQSMAVAIIFGLLVATVLTLGVVPTLYMLYAKYRVRLFVAMGWKVDKEMDIMGIADELEALERARDGDPRGRVVEGG